MYIFRISWNDREILWADICRRKFFYHTCSTDVYAGTDYMYHEMTYNRSIHLSGGWIPGRKKPGRTAGIHGYPAGCHKCQRWPHWWENSRESTSRRGETSGKPGTVVLVDLLILSHFKYCRVIENAWNVEAFTCYCIFIYQAGVCQLFNLIHLIRFSHMSNYSFC